MSTISLCGAVGKNTGALDCDITRGIPTLPLLGSATFLSSEFPDSATMKAAIIGRLKRATGDSEKLFPFPITQGVTDKTVAAKEGALGLGLTFKLLRGRPGFQLEVLAGSSLEKKLIAFDKQQIPVFMYDDKKQIWGKKDSAGNYVGVKYLVGVEPHGYGDGSKPQATVISYSIVDVQDFVENAVVFLSDFSTSDLTGLKDVVLSEQAAHSSNVYKILMTIPNVILNGDVNIFDTYGSLIAAMTWTAGSGANFATSMPITSMAVDNTNKCLTATLDSTAYGLLASGAKIKLTPPSVTTLDTGNVTGVEIGTIILTK